MPTTKLKMLVKGLRLDEKHQPVFDLEPVREAGDALVMVGTADDLNTFRKLFGKTIEARLSIGAEDEADVEQLKTTIERQSKELAEKQQRLDAVVDYSKNIGGNAVDRAEKLEHLARGYLTVVQEQAEKHQHAMEKASLAEKFAGLARTAKEGLAKIEELAAPVKGNGKQDEATTAAVPA